MSEPRRGEFELPEDATELCDLAAHEIATTRGELGDDNAHAVAGIYVGMAIVVRLGELTAEVAALRNDLSLRAGEGGTR